MVGKADLLRLKREIAELQAKKEVIQTYKSHFSDMHKNLHDISQADSSSLSTGEAKGAYTGSARSAKASKTSQDLKQSKSHNLQKVGKITEESENSSDMSRKSKQINQMFSPKSSLVSTRMPNQESIAHWVKRVITFRDSREKQIADLKHTKAARSEAFAA